MAFRLALSPDLYADKTEFLAKIKEFNPDVIGFSLRTTIMDCAKEMLGWLDEALPDIP
jgi:hypothetical protein